jgi:hypothetical protein
MSFNYLDQGYVPEDSYSRQLDRRVASQEYPYGYSTGDFPEGHSNREGDATKYRDKSNSPQSMKKNK